MCSTISNQVTDQKLNQEEFLSYWHIINQSPIQLVLFPQINEHTYLSLNGNLNRYHTSYKAHIPLTLKQYTIPGMTWNPFQILELSTNSSILRWFNQNNNWCRSRRYTTKITLTIFWSTLYHMFYLNIEALIHFKNCTRNQKQTCLKQSSYA